MSLEDEDPRVRDRKRMAHLDKYLSAVELSKGPEYRDAYQERWNEFLPGHPLFTECDAANIDRRRKKALQGLPRIRRGGAEQAQSSEAAAMTSHAGCRHERTTRHCSNAYVKILRCKGCGLELEKTEVEKPEKMQTLDPPACQHLSKDRRGTISTTWQWKCKDCGHVERGHRGSETGPTMKGSIRSDGRQELNPDGAMRVIALTQTILEIQKEVGNHISLKQLDLIYEKCKNHVAKEFPDGTSGAKVSATSTTTTSMDYAHRAQQVRDEVMKCEEAVLLHDKKISTGVHQGKTCREVYGKEVIYCKGLRTKLYSGSIKHTCVEARSFMKDETVAYVLLGDEEENEEEKLDDIASSCNNTCHGDRWMEKFKAFCSEEPAFGESEGRFKGVGGRVDVAGKRNSRSRWGAWTRSICLVASLQWSFVIRMHHFF